jgi:hypothetical protein
MRLPIILLTITGISFAQQAPPGTKLELRVVAVKPPDPPKQEPGDDIHIDPVTEELIAESHGVKIKLPKASREMAADLAVTVGNDGTGMFTYRYKLSNAAGAKRSIAGVSITIPHASAVTASLDRGWGSLPSNLGGNTPVGIMVTKFTDDNDKRLTPGSAVSFVFTSAELPGLARANISPLQDLGPRNPGELTDGQFFDGASEWMRAKMLEMDTNERREVNTYTLGPKVPPAEDNLARVQTELRDASGLPPFVEINQQLIAVSQMATPAQMKSTLNNLGKTPFQRDFTAAMIWRLNRLPQ